MTAAPPRLTTGFPLRLPDGEVVSVRVRPSPRARLLRLVVNLDGTVEVVLPARTPRRQAQALAIENVAWIQTKLALVRRRARAHPRLGLDRPGVVWVQSQAVPVKLVPSRSARAALDNGRLVVIAPDRSEAEAAIERWYRRMARAAIQAEVERQAARLGLHPRSVTVRDQRTRWGSCGIRGDLSFSWRLYLAPNDILEYVVVHELAHMWHHHHQPEYWRRLEEVYPDWRVRVRWLRAHGQELLAYTVVLPSPESAEAAS